MNQEYINPDELIDADRELTFIQTAKKLYAYPRMYHSRMLEQYVELRGMKKDAALQIRMERPSISNKEMSWAVNKVLLNKALFGRCGYPSDTAFHDGLDEDHITENYVISFWNDKQEIYGQLLKPCLQALANKMPDVRIEIHTPFDVVTLGQGQIGTKKPLDTKKELSPEDREKLELQRRLHLMKGAEKKAAMKKLGLTTQGQKHPWQQGTEKAGVTLPGHKWWASQSEDIIRFAELLD